MLENTSYQMKRRSVDELIQHLKTFELDLKFSVGIWYFSDHPSRFHAPLGEPKTIEERLEIIAKLKDYGVCALEAHYPNEINEDNLELYKKFSRDTGIKILSVIPNLFYENDFEFSSLASPIEEVRKKAIERLKTSLMLNKELDCEFCIIWPGGDGYENQFGIDFIRMRDRFAEGIAEAMDAVPGVKVAIEPKPYEPRGRIIYGLTGEGILLAQKVEKLLQNPENKKILEDDSLVGLNPEVGHVLMGFEDLAYAFSLALEYGKLYHTHWNSQPLGNYDQDLNVGVISPEQAEAALYVMKMYGYRGYFGIDINPERMPVERAVINSIDAIKAMNDRINNLPHEDIIACTEKPHKNRGLLEAILIRARANNPSILSPMPKVER
ncbi:Xylose isomerase domain protein TIM barrel [Caldicellulosiruptor saccharolyticus DSM 8903]|uniref:Xylose isomerase n=1 Tax=Caldicellulosiruptor saccharolyticus (strain ATCC 43494 / DSM 8903 / Tp8T 6331) TaxID=351627 RepID=A4XIM4_CALS8|nr:TIM barrel protein [Caldicellulosiruptor saccharolyticus]ABP66759.1 Xylose isomerase domain protein TIM barrel [Caldicellulosiruptor saccharolyticus DSM 8903]